MKNRVFFLIALAALFTAADKDPKQTYIDTFSEIAVGEMFRSGIPASITLAQGIVESAAGQSELAVKGNNHFGIKCHKDWKGRTMLRDDDAKGECFRVYKNPEQSFRDHSDFLRYRDRYKFLFSYDITDYKSWAYGLKKAGYATDPGYPDKLIKIIEDYKLWRFDTKAMAQPGEELVPTPASPLALEEVSRLDPDTSDEEFSFSLKRPVYVKNGVPFVYSAEGESYASIAEAYKLFPREILRFNDLKEDQALLPGTVVYIQPKKSKAAKGLDKYIVDEEEVSLRDICQRFAVKLSAVRRMNSFPSDYVPADGDTVLLRPQSSKKTK